MWKINSSKVYNFLVDNVFDKKAFPSIIFVSVFPLKPPLFSVPKTLFLSFVLLHALEKDTRSLSPALPLLKVKFIGGASDFSYSGF